MVKKKKFFVTCQIEKLVLEDDFFYWDLFKYAIECSSQDKAKEVALDIYSLCGYKYIRISNKPRLSDRILCNETNYLKTI